MDEKCATFKNSLSWCSYGLCVYVCVCAVFLSSQSTTFLDLPKFAFCVGDRCVFKAIYHQLVQKCTTTAVQRELLHCISSAARTPWKKAQGLERASQPHHGHHDRLSLRHFSSEQSFPNQDTQRAVHWRCTQNLFFFFLPDLSLLEWLTRHWVIFQRLEGVLIGSARLRRTHRWTVGLEGNWYMFCLLWKAVSLNFNVRVTYRVFLVFFKKYFLHFWSFAILCKWLFKH